MPFNPESAGLPPSTFNAGNPLWDGTAKEVFRFATLVRRAGVGGRHVVDAPRRIPCQVLDRPIC